MTMGLCTVNDWGLTYNTDYSVSNSRKRRPNERSSFSVKLCPICNTAFELVFNQYRKESDIHYYKHFYRRGLYEEKCLKCR